MTCWISKQLHQLKTLLPTEDLLLYSEKSLYAQPNASSCMNILYNISTCCWLLMKAGYKEMPQMDFSFDCSYTQSTSSDFQIEF